MEYLSPPLEQNPSALLQTFNEAMETAFPGWTPAPASLAARLAGAGSQTSAQLMEAASDGATNLFRYFGANIAGLLPHEGLAASGTATWTLTDTLGHSIPVGTVAVWLDGFGNRWGLETLAEVTVAPGAKEAVGVSMRATAIGTGSNGLSGNAVELSSPLAFVASITLPSATNGGSEAEADSEYLNRLVAENTTLSPTPITPRDFNIILTSKTGVGRAYTLRGFNPAGTVAHAGTTTGIAEITGLTTAVTEQLVPGTVVTGTAYGAGTYVTEVGAGTVKLNQVSIKSETATATFTGTIRNAGFCTSWVGNAAGEALSGGIMAELEAEIQEECLAGVTFKVLAATYTTVNIAATVVAWPGQNPALIKEAVETAIKTFMLPERWGQLPTGQTKEWGNESKVRIVNAEHAALQVVGTHYISSLTLNAGSVDVPLPGVVPMPKLGTLAVTVNIG